MNLRVSTAYLFGATFFLVLCGLYWPFVADDAFIVGRYALNAAEGQGLVFNVGERISALTSPLHALVETVLALAGLDPVAAFRLLAVTLPLIAVAIALRQLDLSLDRAVLAIVVGLCSPFLALWTVGGLETPLLAFLATLFVVRIIGIFRKDEASDRDFLWLGLLSGLMFLTRFDSVLVFLPVLLAILCVEWRRRSLWFGAALGGALAFGWLAFSQVYFEEILPTSFYVKLRLSSRGAFDNIATSLNFLILSGALVLLFYLPRGQLPKGSRLQKAILIGGSAAISLFAIYSIRAAGQHMMFGYRHFMPYLTSMALIASLLMRPPSAYLIVGLAGLQASLAAVVLVSGINPAPLSALPILKRAHVEYQYVRPSDYGAFMAALEAGAENLRQHWAQHGDGSPPRVYLKTGGMGYWLLDFYVYETLVSFRHACGVPLREIVGSSHYVQDISFLPYPDHAIHARDRSDVPEDAELLAPIGYYWMEPAQTAYFFGPRPSEFDLGTTINSPCLWVGQPFASYQENG